MAMDLRGGAVPNKAWPKLKLRFQPWITVSQEEELYTILSLIAEVGGYVGLMCGYSMLTLIQWIYQWTHQKFNATKYSRA